MAQASWLDALLGALFSDGNELELVGGLNFVGFTINQNTLTNSLGETVYVYDVIAPGGAGSLAASDITNDSSVAASSTVKDALNTLLSSIAANTTNIATNTSAISTLQGRQIIAGTNLSGGGTLAADRTLSLSATLTGITSINGAKIIAPTQGTDLTDADQTLTIGNGANYVMPASTTSTARNKTLGTSGAATGDVMSIAVYAQGHNVVIKDDAGTVLYTVTAGTKRVVDARFNGTHFADACAKPIQ